MISCYSNNKNNNTSYSSLQQKQTNNINNSSKISCKFFTNCNVIIDDRKIVLKTIWSFWKCRNLLNLIGQFNQPVCQEPTFRQDNSYGSVDGEGSSQVKNKYFLVGIFSRHLHYRTDLWVNQFFIEISNYKSIRRWVNFSNRINFETFWMFNNFFRFFYSAFVYQCLMTYFDKNRLFSKYNWFLLYRNWFWNAFKYVSRKNWFKLTYNNFVRLSKHACLYNRPKWPDFEACDCFDIRPKFVLDYSIIGGRLSGYHCTSTQHTWFFDLK